MRKISFENAFLGIVVVALVALVIYHRVAFIELFAYVFAGGN